MSIWKSIGSFFSSLFQKKESITVETVSTNDKQQEDTVVEEITKPIVIETDTDKDNTVEVTEDVSDTIDNDITIDKITINDSDNSEEPVKEEILTANKLYSNVCVFLDPGHTDKTPGKRSPDNRLYEWKYNREIVKMIESELDKLGIEHWNSHPEDSWVDSSHNTDSKDLVLRCQRINKKYTEVRANNKKAFMISVHVNAAGSGDWYNATGWSAYTTKGQNNSDKLADCLYDAAEEILVPLGKKLRTDKSDGDRDNESNFYIIKHSNCVCALTENFFMDNKDDVDFLLSDKGKEAIVKVHIEGIKKYIEKYC